VNQSRNEKNVQTQGLARKRVWLAWGILVAAIIITILATFYMKSDVDVQAKREFIFGCNEIRAKIDVRLKDHEQILISGAALFDASDQVTREQWKTFVQRLNAESNLPGIQGIGFALRIPPDRLAHHVKDIRSEGFPNYDVRPEGDRGDYSSIIYLEPFLGRNLRAFGYDMLSEPVRRSAMERARDHNEAALSGKVVLVQETDKDIQAGSLMYVPVYRTGMPTGTVEQRREALFGWVYSPYRMTDLMRGTLGGWDSLESLRIRLQVYDGTLLFSDAILYDSQAANDMGLAPQFTEDLQVTFNGSPWTLRFIQAGGQVSHVKVWLTLAAGVIISLLLFGLTLSLLNTRFIARQMAERLTAELRESEERWQFALEGARDGVWDWNAQTNEVFFSRQWKVMLGYEEHEIGTTLDEWDKRVHPDDKESCYADLERHFSGETPFYQNEHRVLCKDGNYKWILDRGKVMELMDDGKPLRVIGTHTDISEHRRVQEALQERQAFFADLTEVSPAGIWTTDADGNNTFASKRWSEITGITRENAYGSGWVKGVHPNDRDVVFQGWVRSAKEGMPYTSEFRFVHPDGAVVWVFCQAIARVDDTGKIVGWVGTITDITERKLVDEALRASEERFRGLFERHNAIMLLVEPESGRIVDANNAAERFYGYTPSRLRSMSIQDINILPPDEVDRERESALQEHRNYFIFPHRLADGEVRTVEVHSSPIDLNNVKVLFSVIHDITDRKSAESRLAEISELNQQIIAGSPVGISIYKADGQCIVANDAIVETIGTTKEQILSQNFRQIKSWQDSGLMDMAAKTLNTGVKTSGITLMELSFGKVLWLSCLFSRFYLRDDPHLLLMCSDMSDLKNAERNLQELNQNLEERVAERSADLLSTNRQLLREINEHSGTASSLRESEQRMKMVIESSPVGIFVIQDEKYIFANQAFVNIFGLTDSSDVVGTQLETLYSADSGKRISDIARQCVDRSEMININGLQVLTRDEQACHLNIWIQPIETWGSSAVMGFMVDISGEVELRSHLNKSQKMEALGSLAGGIAHDFNNVLFGIGGYTELALKSIPSDSPASKQLKQALAATERAADLVRHILTFSREAEQEKRPLLISLILKESLNFLRATITQNVEIRRNISADLHSVKSDPTQIHQIIMNLVTNAAHAMKNTGGVLEVGLVEVSLTEDFVKTRPGMVPGTYQKLKVSDTGHGMTPETLERIFDPYFTTKQPGEGTGLGLSVVYGIVRDNNGTITVSSVPDAGTTFEVYFPIVMEKETSSEETDQVASLGTGRILFVDDETMVTNGIGPVIEDLGYEVVAENDPVRALSKFEAQPYSFDLIITDMSMPKMTGLQLSMKISEIRKDIPIILMTGFSDLLDDKTPSDYGIREFIYKPIRKLILAQTISKVLTKQDLTGGTDG